MKRLLLSMVVLLGAGMAQAQTRAPAPAAAGTVTPAPTSPLDGQWRGRSDGGSCNAPLDYLIVIENGFVDGSAYDATAQGPVPNLKKAPAPAPTPGLWQIHGLAKPGGTFSLISVASVKGHDRRESKLTARSEGGGLVISETGGCRRTV
ncbi:MAG: hypothetical protein FJX11_22175, partial [Alphaproteobacteria bacterium]|nr:hypothetical protein [Alphaproteobacteria bacterium]